MKIRTLAFLFCAILVATLVSGCKKGADDPFFSIWSRDARLCNEWKLKTVTATNNSTTTAGSTSLIDNYTFSYDGSSFEISNTFSEPFTGDVVTEIEGLLNYLLDMKIEKEGLCEVVETYTDSGVGSSVSNTLVGSWYWTGDDQSKTGIVMDILASTVLGNSAWEITELKNKEMKWIYQSSSIEVNGSASTTSSYDWEVVFEKK